jgi:solute carrier family 50 (sugar transporter)
VYGLLHNDIFPLMVTNATGAVLGALYTAVYYHFTTDKPYAHKVFAGFGAVIFLITLYAILGRSGYTGQSHDSVAKVMGILGNVFVFVFFVAPFENIKQVFRHRSGVFLPILLVLANVLNGSAWLTYGLLVSDMIVIVPNVGAVTISGIQVAVYLYFHPSTHPYHPPATATADLKDLEAASTPVASPSFVALQSPVHVAVPAQE